MGSAGRRPRGLDDDYFFFAFFEYFGINHRNFEVAQIRMFFFERCQINYKQPYGQSDLWSGQTYTFGVDHSLVHVIYQFF